MRTLRFARLNFKTKLSDFQKDHDEYEERRNKLLEVIDYETNLNSLIEKSGVDVPKENVKWNFAGIKSDERYIYGKLGKERDINRKKRDDTRKDYVEEKLENADVARFLIDIKESIIVYEYRRNVGAKAPYRVIEAAFNEYHSEKDNLRINVLTDRKKFIKRLEELNKIKHIELNHLEPTNPNSTDSSDKMDKFLEKGSIEKMNIDAEGEDEEGIELSELPLIRSAFHLAEEGHGSAKIDGEDSQGNEKSFGTGDVPITQEREIDRDDADNKGILESAVEKAVKKLKETGQEDV